MFYYKGHSMLTTLPSPSAQTIRQSVPDQEDIIRRSLERSARYGVDPHIESENLYQVLVAVDGRTRDGA